MKVLVAREAGFCFGVKRAIELVREARKSRSADLATLGPLIHNPQVVAGLEKEGICAARALEEVEAGALAIPSHGVAPQVRAAAAEKGLEVVDATCPFVARAQEHVSQLREEGYEVVILGDRGHPEVQGLVGHAAGAVCVIQTAQEAEELPIRPKYGLVAQTTQEPARLGEAAAILAGRCRELRVFNTICGATRSRQESTRELASQVEAMVVIGGRNSANTARLRHICEEAGLPTHHVETAAELRPEWFAGLERVGVTAGASTPEEAIQEVVARLRESSGE
jgi:4-hydroxy-3-methylbut-2-enyl diphosphate reductase